MDHPVQFSQFLSERKIITIFRNKMYMYFKYYFIALDEESRQKMNANYNFQMKK